MVIGFRETCASSAAAATILLLLLPAPAAALDSNWKVAWSSANSKCTNNYYSVGPLARWGNPNSGTFISVNSTSTQVTDAYANMRTQEQCGATAVQDWASGTFTRRSPSSAAPEILPNGVDGSSNLAFMFGLFQGLVNGSGAAWRPLYPGSTLAMRSESKLGANRIRQVAEFAIEACVDAPCAYTVPLICPGLAAALANIFNTSATFPVIDPPQCYRVYERWSVASATGVQCSEEPRAAADGVKPNNLAEYLQLGAMTNAPVMTVTGTPTTVKDQPTSLLRTVDLTGNSQVGRFYSSINVRIASPALPQNSTLLPLPFDPTRITVINNGDTNKANGYVSTFPFGCVGDACYLSTSGKLYGLWNTTRTPAVPANITGFIHFNSGSQHLYVESYSRAACSAQGLKTWSLLINNYTIYKEFQQGTNISSIITLTEAEIVLVSGQAATVGCAATYVSQITVAANGTFEMARAPHAGNDTIDHDIRPIDDDYFSTKNDEILQLIQRKQSMCQFLGASQAGSPINAYRAVRTQANVYAPSQFFNTSNNAANIRMAGTLLNLVDAQLPQREVDIVNRLLDTAGRKFKGTTHAENVLALVSTMTVMTAMLTFDFSTIGASSTGLFGRLVRRLFSRRVLALSILLIGCLVASGAPAAILTNNILAKSDDSLVITAVTNSRRLSFGENADVYVLYMNQYQLLYCPPHFVFSLVWSCSLLSFIAVFGLIKALKTLRVPNFDQHPLVEVTAPTGTQVGLVTGGVTTAVLAAA